MTGAAVASAPLAAAPTAEAAESDQYVQLGPTTRTVNTGPGGVYSVLGLRNNDPRRNDDGTRMYIVPSSPIARGVGGALKVFGDPYFDGLDYRDMGWYFNADQAGDTGHHGTGAFWLNSKVQGSSYEGKNPDIGFSFQDGLTVAARFSYLGDKQPVLVVGPGRPDIATRMPDDIRLEMQGDVGFTGSGRGIRWYGPAGTSADNLLQFNNDNVRLVIDAQQRLMVYSDGGSVVMGDEATELDRTAIGGFLYLRSMPGRPLSIPTERPGTVPLVMDSRAGKLWARVGGTWKSVKFT